MEYKAKYKLNKNQYLAEVGGFLVIVTTDDDGKIVRGAIFGTGEKNEKEAQT
jgi:hypothetical protein